jgi:hypothetical protein
MRMNGILAKLVDKKCLRELFFDLSSWTLHNSGLMLGQPRIKSEKKIILELLYEFLHLASLLLEVCQRSSSCHGRYKVSQMEFKTINEREACVVLTAGLPAGNA